MEMFGYCLISLLLNVSIFGLVLFAVLCLILLKFSKPYPDINRSDDERYFPTEKEKSLFPTWDEKWSVNLSVIVPAYDEEERLPPMLDECMEFLENRRNCDKNFTYEVIVASDGSRDRTVKVATEYSLKYGSDKFRVLNLRKNRGKGGAVRLGIQSARGAVILFADADGATTFEDLVRLEQSLKDTLNVDYKIDPETAAAKEAIICGSRAHLEDEAIATRSIFRTFLMYGFHMLVWIFTVRGVRDTQCGFKLLTRSAAITCFRSLHVERWAFDVEMLYIAQKKGIPINEVAVNWTEIEGSKVVPVLSWLQMGRDLFLIWLRYQLGAWKLRDVKSE